MKRNRTVYFDKETLRQIEAEMARQERTFSWLIERAWRIARARLQAMPSHMDRQGG